MESYRIPFSVAVAEPKLLKPHFDTLSLPQRVALLSMYGCPLSNQIKDHLGHSELDYWAMLQGSCTYTPLGFLETVTPIPYIPHEFKEAWMVSGVRAGKTFSAATIVAYEATCGGHEIRIGRGRKALCFQICQDLKFARYSLHGIKAVLDSMPFIADEHWIANVTADRIDLINGITVATCPPTVKSVRGYDVPVAVLDEVGVWYQEQDSANPDVEVYRAVSSRQAQFTHPKIIGISSPWNQGGMLFDRFNAGTNGSKLSCVPHANRPYLELTPCPACQKIREPHQDRLLLHATTAGLNNPLITRAWIESERSKDPKAFERECLAKFQRSISGFLDASALEDAIDRGVHERAPEPLNVYVAAIDPAFKHDAFGLAIGHSDPSRGVIIDVVRRIAPPQGSSLALNPEQVIAQEIVPLLKAYKVLTVFSDQYQFESLNQLAFRHGFSITSLPFTASSKTNIYGNLRMLLNQRRMRLIDHEEMIDELGSLESKLTESGNMQIGAPRGKYDDLATVVALVAHQSAWLFPITVKTQAHREPTPYEVCQAQIKAKTRSVVDTDVW